MKFNYLIFILVAIFILGCSSLSRVDHIPLKIQDTRDLVVFFDGTNNDEGSHTNIAKLNNLVTLQNRPDISTTYIKGVGTGSKIIGMAMGWGIGDDVREAYLYLIDNYDQKYEDKISIFGFSRGAYAARILAALLYVAGIPDAKNLTKKERKKLVADIYGAYKKDGVDIQSRRDSVSKIIGYPPKSVNVKFLGLWETVEALGWPDLQENINEPNKYYADQLCNIEAAAQALSLDDDRARIFTPLLLSRKHLRDYCKNDKVNNKGKIHEVWFSGAHSDLGGGYKDTNIDGVSLNWMLDEMKLAGLDIVPKNTKVYSNFLGKTHNPEGGLFGIIYRERSRNIPCYTEVTSSPNELCTEDKHDGDYRNTFTSLSSPIKIHQSVLDRLCIKTPENHESFWFRAEKYKNCLACDSNNIGYVKKEGRCKTIEAVGVDKNHTYKSRKVTKEDNYCDYSVFSKDLNSTRYKDAKSCNYSHKFISTRAQQRLTKTDLDTNKTIIVYADVKNDRTGIYLSKDKSYSFTINEKEVEDWIDSTIKATPEKGRKTWIPEGDFYKNLINVVAKPLTYAPTSGYMELLGQVGNEQFKLGRFADAENNKTFTPKESGELILRVNEPRFLDFTYKNNFGVLKLKIEVK